ncbi:MAG TPA: nuclear transport factor 2 family protein [Kofleriaceae bacterium]|nr:nuclear transport factor 2 family protein [Kofleriaceae bacterium]
MPTAVANADLVRGLYRAFTDRDIPALEEIIAENAVWHVPGRSRLAGDHRGRPAVLAYFAGLAQRTEGTFSAEIIDVLATESRAVALARATGHRQPNVHYDGLYCLVVSFERDQICEAWLMPADLYSLDEFLS